MEDAGLMTTFQNAPLKFVQVDALVLFKIIKHYEEHTADVIGCLLGYAPPGEEKLQVTHSFPTAYFRPGGEIDEEGQTTEMARDMCFKLRLVNVDSVQTGHYMTVGLHAFPSLYAVRWIYAIQKERPSVLLVYNPLQAANGAFAFKAYRLTEDFMQRFSQDETGEDIALDAKAMKSAEIFEEIPVKINNSLLVEAFLNSWTKDIAGPNGVSNFNSLDMESQSNIEKNVQYLGSCLAELGNAHWNLVDHEKRKGAKGKGKGDERAKDAPSKLQPMVLSNQITRFCQEINSFSRDSFGRLFLVGGFQTAE
mmetsp:Transcript_12164/g.30376  ORF Transcript_12164/g.30376 Transcript_12164/m.30376 type:complete len:308 (+) Transcript_12164:76-999(+)